MGNENRFNPVAPPEVWRDLEQQLEGLAGEDGKNPWTFFTPDFIDTRIPDVSQDTIMEAIHARQKVKKEAAYTQEAAEVKIDTGFPVLPIASGDWHFGAVGTDHDKLLADLEKVKATAGAGLILGGNLIDNGIPGMLPDVMLRNAIPPQEQVLMVRKILMDLNAKGKILAAIPSPCHEGWTYKKAGQDVNALLHCFEGRNYPVLQNGGILSLWVGEQVYKIAVYHKTGPFESNFNHTHSTKQMNRLRLGMQADIVMAFHRHWGTAEHVFDGTGPTLRDNTYIRGGCYKLEDEWAIANHGVTGEPGGQSVLLWPDKRKMTPFLELDTALEVQEAVYLRAWLDYVGMTEKVRGAFNL
jgi:hypothetical protein